MSESADRYRRQIEVDELMVTAAAEAHWQAMRLRRPWLVAWDKLGRADRLPHLIESRAALTAALSVAEPGCRCGFQSAAAAHRRAETRCAELASELDRLREAAQAVVASSESDELPGTVAYRLVPANEIRSLRAVLESDGAPADRPAAREDER